jgi:hypothetical protein
MVFPLLDEHFGIPSESVWKCTVERISHPPLLFDSVIISNYPEILAEFERKRISLLSRDSRDGFKANEFHSRCDSRANTLTMILDTKGNIFGGFTPVKWKSRMWNGKKGSESNTWKVDDSQKSFLFALNNPNNILTKRFVLKAEEKHREIGCNSKRDPSFGHGFDIGVSDKLQHKHQEFQYLWRLLH